jgi:hypothetical protein
MPARRKPTALLEASGAFDRNPARRREREGEPVPEGPLGEPPAEWLELMKAGNPKYVKYVGIWYELAAQAQFGVLSSMDRFFVEQTVDLVYNLRRGMAGHAARLTAGEQSQLNKNLGQMGCIPSERSRVKGQQKSAEVASEWADLAAEQQDKRTPVN